MREPLTDQEQEKDRVCEGECVCEREMERHASALTGSPPSEKQQEQHSNPHLLFLFILQSLFFLYSPPSMCVGVAGS